MSEDKPQDPREYWKDFPEAPFSDSFKWVDEQGFEHLSTVRGWQFSALMTTIQRAESSIIDFGGKPIITIRPTAPAAPAPAPDKPAQIAMQEGNPQMAAQLQAQADAVPPAPNGQAWQTVDINEIRIEPKSDGMVSVEFWNPGRKYAEEYVKWKPENVLGLLKHVMTVPTNDDGSIKPSILSCKCRVYFTLGKEKTGPNAKPGSRWHDVAHVRPL